MKRILGLIPSRIGSKRLHAKALLPINNYPLIVHVYKRAKLSKMLNDVYVCCDHKKIYETVKRYGGKAILTSKKHKNGTERIAEGYKLLKKKYDLILDIQGDEPLINPNHINNVINFHKNNLNADIIVPSLKIKHTQNENIVKVIKDKNKNVLYFSRSSLPYGFKMKTQYLQKHLSIISFKPNALQTYMKSKQTFLEKVEGIELLRALEIGLKIKSPSLSGDSFSIDIKEDYIKAKIRFEKDRFYKLYKGF
jgi:3-deoxy-manno-octulosonate cytidylyltransferase (CMP-KDO synthetase)|tara:strand:+ start:133 stop:885 length:753 start_codon:yes stop_codon:yes gene_type:complete